MQSLVVPISRQRDADCGIAVILYTTKEALNLDDLPDMENALAFRSFIAGSFLMGSARISRRTVNTAVPPRSAVPSQLASVKDTPVLPSPLVPPPPRHVSARAAQSNRSRAEALMTSDADLL